MEEAAIVIIRTLTVLIIPVGLAGITVGLLTTIRRPGFQSTDVNAGTTRERIAVGLCAGLSALGILGILIASLRRTPPPSLLAIVVGVMIVLVGTPGFAWRSRWRGSMEGLATAALSVAAILTGFSIGILFVPLVMLMISVCIRRLTEPALPSRPLPVSRVDSSP